MISSAHCLAGVLALGMVVVGMGRAGLDFSERWQGWQNLTKFSTWCCMPGHQYGLSEEAFSSETIPGWPRWASWRIWVLAGSGGTILLSHIRMSPWRRSWCRCWCQMRSFLWEEALAGPTGAQGFFDLGVGLVLGQLELGEGDSLDVQGSGFVMEAGEGRLPSGF